MVETHKEAQLARKRPWFQIHLSTAIVLMFVAGGLLWANMREHIIGTGTVHWDGPGPPGLKSDKL